MSTASWPPSAWRLSTRPSRPAATCGPAAAAAVRFQLDRGELVRALDPRDDAAAEAQALALVRRLQELSAVVNRTGG